MSFLFTSKYLKRVLHPCWYLATLPRYSWLMISLIFIRCFSFLIFEWNSTLLITLFFQECSSSCHSCSFLSHLAPCWVAPHRPESPVLAKLQDWRAPSQPQRHDWLSGWGDLTHLKQGAGATPGCEQQDKVSACSQGRERGDYQL